MDPWKYKLGEEVTVRYPSGRELDGVISARRRRGPNREHNRYTVLFDNDTADTTLSPTWIYPRRQRSLLD